MVCKLYLNKAVFLKTDSYHLTLKLKTAMAFQHPFHWCSLTRLPRIKDFKSE